MSEVLVIENGKTEYVAAIDDCSAFAKRECLGTSVCG